MDGRLAGLDIAACLARPAARGADPDVLEYFFAVGEAAAVNAANRKEDRVAHGSEQRYRQAVAEGLTTSSGGLEALGADGEKALRRIDAAGRAPSAGLRALGAASDELKGKLGDLSGHAGSFGTALQALGPRGLVAAAGIGAVVVALAAAINKAREAGEFFARARRRRRARGHFRKQAGDAAGRLSSPMPRRPTRRTPRSCGFARRSMMRCRAARKRNTAFQNVGVSMEWLSKNGGDTVDVLMKIAQHGGLTAGQLNDLTGKIGNALVPAMQELSKVGVQSNEEFDALTKQINEAKDQIEITRPPDERARAWAARRSSSRASRK